MARIVRLIRDHRGAAAVIGVVLVGGFAFGMYWFQPWKLFTDRVVSEAAPGGPIISDRPSEPAAPPSQPSESHAPTAPGVTPADEPSAAPPSPTPSGPAVVAAGGFTSLAHETLGRAVLLRLEDGSHVVRFEGFSTSDGPDVRVYLAAAPADAPEHEFEADFVDLGGLKGNIGDQNYSLPADVDPARFQSVVVWCRRFSVGFGVAPIV